MRNGSLEPLEILLTLRGIAVPFDRLGQVAAAAGNQEMPWEGSERLLANLATEILVFGGVVPAITAAGVVLVTRWLGSGPLVERYPLALGLAAGFFSGYALLPSWAELVPQRHWHWLPFLGVAAMVVGSVRMAAGVRLVERWALEALLAIVAAWLLVPTWASLEPPRSFYVPLLAAYLFLQMVLLVPLTTRVGARTLLAQWCLVAAVVSASIAYFLNLMYGQVGGIAAASLMGCLIVVGHRGRETLVCGAIPVFVVLVGGTAFVGYVEPTEPKYAILALPLAPHVLWAFAVGPLAHLDGIKAVVAQTVAVLAALAVTITWLLMT